MDMEAMLNQEGCFKRVRASIRKHYISVDEFVDDFMLYATRDGFVWQDPLLKVIIPHPVSFESDAFVLESSTIFYGHAGVL